MVAAGSEWSFTICLMPYNCITNVLGVSLNKTWTFHTEYLRVRVADTKEGHLFVSAILRL